MYINELTAAEHATRAVAATPKTERPKQLLLVVSRMRFQLIAGLILAVIVPALLRHVYEPQNGPPIELDKSLIGTIWAFLFGYLLFRKVTGYPGVRASAYILPVFVAAYVITIAGFFLLRLEYSRLQLGASFFLSVIFFYWVFIIVRRQNRMRLAVIPGGDASRLETLKSVEWTVLTTPDPTQVSSGIVADLRSDLSDEWERFIADRALAGVPVYNAKHVMESLSGRVQIDHLSENPFGALTPNLIYNSGKRYIDFLIALVALIILSPLIAIAALAIRLETPGPAFFRQERMGWRGRPFTVFKLRTMRVIPISAVSLQSQMTQPGDPRITTLGRFMRKTRIDELPQLFNILRGEMSWIGPRPEALKLSEWYEAKIPFYRYRHIVRPGITGWAQVNQGHVTSVDDANVKLQYDFFYVKNLSLWLDVLVLLRTVRVIFTGSGAK